MPKPYKMIDLFAGAGGMTQGFVRAGFVPVLAVEKEPDFAATYAENFGKHIVADDIVEVCKHDIDFKADVVIGGPPCQGFSNLTGNQASDSRREMWRYFMDIVEKTDCKVFVVENVPNLLKSPEAEGLIRKARKLGFFVGDYSTGILCAADYGVPQNRRRAIIMGSKLGRICLPPPNGIRRTVRDALSGIPLRPTYIELDVTPVTAA